MVDRECRSQETEAGKYGRGGALPSEVGVESFAFVAFQVFSAVDFLPPRRGLRFV
jgi:hypothetical protein